MSIKKWMKKKCKTHQCTKGCIILATTAAFSLKSSAMTSLSVKLTTSCEDHIVSGKTDVLPVHNTKRTTLQQVNIPKYKYPCQFYILNQYQHAYLWSLANPFGATLSSSSFPNTFCRSPSGCGLASPKNSTNSGAEMMDRNRCGFRWILDLHKDVKPNDESWKDGNLPDGRKLVLLGTPGTSSKHSFITRFD